MAHVAGCVTLLGYQYVFMVILILLNLTIVVDLLLENVILGLFVHHFIP